jgi:hypothetical protein
LPAVAAWRSRGGAARGGSTEEQGQRCWPGLRRRRCWPRPAPSPSPRLCIYHKRSRGKRRACCRVARRACGPSSNQGAADPGFGMMDLELEAMMAELEATTVPGGEKHELPPVATKSARQHWSSGGFGSAALVRWRRISGWRSGLRYGRAGASRGTHGRWGWEGGFGCLPTLGTRVGTLLEWSP